MGWVGTGPLHQAAASASCSWVSEACLRQAPCRGPSPRAPPFPAYGQVPREEDRGGPVSRPGPVSGPRAAPKPGKRAPSRSLCFLELDNARGFRSGAREAASSPRPSPKVNGRDTDEASEAAPVFGEVPPWSARPSAPRPAAGVGEGTWLGMRLCASGRVSTRDTWRRVEQRRASHSPRGFPALWRALRAHVAGPGLCSGRSSLGCAVSVGPSQVAPRLWPARPREPDSATLQTLPRPPGGRRTVSPSGTCCVLGDTLHGGGGGGERCFWQPLSLAPRVQGHRALPAPLPAPHPVRDVDHETKPVGSLMIKRASGSPQTWLALRRVALRPGGVRGSPGAELGRGWRAV